MLLRRTKTIFLTACLAALTLFALIHTLQPVQAADLIVNPGESIQAAIDAAGTGDTIIIQAGSYTESLTLNKAISLTGVSSDTVILHAEPNNRVLTVTGAVIDHQVVISGLTFTGGNLGTSNSCPDCGGGILITGTARPLIQSVILDRNKADFGAAIYSHNNSPLELSQVKVISNGLYAITAEAPLTISHSSFLGNSFGVLAYETLSVNESQFVNDAGIFALAPAAVYKSYFENATISTTAHILVTGSQFISSSYTALRANSATVEHSYFAHAYIEDYPFRPWQEGGAIYTADALTLTHSTVIDNQADSGGGVFRVGDVRVVSSYFEGNEGEGIISDKGNILISDTQIINNIDGFGAVATLHNPSSPTEVHIIDSLISGTIDGNGVWIGSPMWITNSQIVYSEGSGVLAANDVHIAKSTIAHNGNSQYGGLGLYITNGDAYIAESDISYNGNTDGVGGLYIQGNVTVDRSTFLGNIMNGFHTDMGGGGGVKSDGYVTVTNSLFQENSCVNGCYGGSIYAKKGLTISNTEFISNSAEHFGGAAFTHGTAYITNSTFISNAAVNGAGGVMYASEAYIANSRFIANRGLIIPGILMGDGTVLNSLFLNNDVFDIGSESPLGGSAITSNGFVTVSHITVSASEPLSLPAIYLFREYTFVPKEIQHLFIQNSIIENHRMALATAGDPITEDYNLYFNNTTNFTETVSSGGHSIFEQDPLFVDPAAGNYRLQGGSPAIDAAVELGIPFDLDGRPRPLGHAPDIGAYESGRVTPIISLSSTDYRVTENQNALITLTLDSAYTDTVTVDFITADVSATSGSDYVPISQTIVFTASVTSQTVTIPIIDDLLVENDEALQITLSNPENGRLLGISEALVTIQDNDTPPPAPLPTLNFDAENYATTEGETSVLITFTLDITSSEAVSVQLTTIDLSAVAGADYTVVSETIVFPKGTTVQTVTIPILDDTAVEGAETFKILLSDPQNGVLGLNSTAVVTILDDDAPLPEFVLYLPLVITN